MRQTYIHSYEIQTLRPAKGQTLDHAKNSTQAQAKR